MTPGLQASAADGTPPNRSLAGAAGPAGETFVARTADVKDFAGTFGVAIGGSKVGPDHWPGCAPD